MWLMIKFDDKKVKVPIIKLLIIRAFKGIGESQK